VHAHEFGRIIGMWDEYPGEATIAAYSDVKGSIMNKGTKVMPQHWTKHPEPGKSIHNWFLDAANDDYKLLKV